MHKSNIFVYNELSKLVSNLTTNILMSKRYLKSQAGYFNILVPTFFSDTLSPEWESIVADIKKIGPKFDSEGKLVTNAIMNTIDQMSDQECIQIALRIMKVYEKIQLEFEA